MMAQGTFLILLLYYLLSSIWCQKELLQRTDDIVYLTNSTTKRPNFSNIQFINDDDNNNTRHKRGSTQKNLHELLKKIKLGRDQQPGINKYADPLVQLKYAILNDRTYVTEFNCIFDTDCSWSWRKDIANGFYITRANNVKLNDTGPKVDANNHEYGSYLILRLPPKSTLFQVVSPLLSATAPSCKLNISINQENMEGGSIRVVGEKLTIHSKDESFIQPTQWMINTIDGNNLKQWEKHELPIGKITSKFRILLEVVSAEKILPKATVAFDNIIFSECFIKSDETCSSHQYKCRNSKECINGTRVCDLVPDCPEGDDEEQNCHLMPYGSRCNFEDEDWCGWRNVNKKNNILWARHRGPTPSNSTGPDYDHTFMNATGNYLYVNMFSDRSNFGNGADLISVIFNPPPKVHGDISSNYYNTCAIRFYMHKTGKHKSSIKVVITELTPNENKTTSLYWSYMEDHGDQWIRRVLRLPNITYRYTLHFEVRKGISTLCDIGIDDVSLTPECFGINVPEIDLQGYNYWNPKLGDDKETVDEFKNKTYYKFTTCRNTGRYGPSNQKCTKEYNGTDVNVRVLYDAGLSGIQKWIVPKDGLFTIILAGASGGKGSSGLGTSRGSVVRTVVDFKEGQELFMLIGQQGTDACFKALGIKNNCSMHNDPSILKNLKKNTSVINKIQVLMNFTVNDTGGGGGGGTFLFTRNKLTKQSIPLAVAGGGGGLGMGKETLSNAVHGQGFMRNFYLYRETSRGNGAGGGWTDEENGIMLESMGYPVLSMGGIGGKPCYNSSGDKGYGGFGGGGGGCKKGGGGGGFFGGNVRNANNTFGDGGTSFVDYSVTRRGFSVAEMGQNNGPGFIMIIPAVEGCDCDFYCIALDEKRSQTECTCPDDWRLHENKKSCIPINLTQPYPSWFVVGLIITVFCLTVAFGTVCFVLYNRYQIQVSGLLSRKGCPIADVQLTTLRQSSGGAGGAQYNPNYEFGGVITTIDDLLHIPRSQLRLLKALGQGAFGEVFHGMYTQRPGDTVEMPVAVKSLQEMTVKQAEDDFLTEALIMSKFNHPNIVHFIGICFEKNPKFIVLELLTGGDLKNFLRESRPKPDRPSQITMRDLVLIAIDIAKGCKYLEDRRFIHRDIAARNCLLTTKGPGRVSKIADFGMSRDIYRADYYRKDGRAMLPVKWMPPEAYLEGLFSSKTDVWSFGILLWEIMKMGFMPYTGCSNREVMDLVQQGGRLEPPENCPVAIYKIMRNCWSSPPSMRPSFSVILERLNYCLQDSEVINTTLPIFHMNVPSESDLTIMRPMLMMNDSNYNFLRILNPSDYLIPNHTDINNVPTTPDALESTSSIEKLIPDNKSANNNNNNNNINNKGNNNWETSFIIPSSKSTQPLLDSSNNDDDFDEETTPTVMKINSHRNEDYHHTSSASSRNSPNINNETSIKSGISLDASALAKSAHQNKIRYINVDENGIIKNGVLPNTNNNSNNSAEMNC